MYLSSNGVIANIVQNDLDRLFKCHKISGNHIIFNIWKTVRANKKCSITTVIAVDVSRGTAQL